MSDRTDNTDQSASAGAMLTEQEVERRVGERTAALSASEARYRALFERMDEAFAVVEVLRNESGQWSDFRFIEVNPAFMAHTGMPYPVDRTATELLGSPNPRWAQVYGRVADTGEPIRWQDAELTLGRTFDLSAFRLGGEGSAQVAVLFTDISARKALESTLQRAADRQDLLLHELQHRVRNILALVRSVIRRSAEGAEDADDLEAHLMGRIDAMARTQSLLTRDAGAGIDLGDLVHDELLAQAAPEGRFTVEGPEIMLDPKAAEILTMAVHELATNANKYGALATENGRIAVGWRLVDEGGEPWVQLEWRETNVPVVARSPRREGFGTELIVRRVPYELRGQGTLELRPGGVVAQIAFPLRPSGSIPESSSAWPVR